MIAHGAKHPGLQISKGHVIGKAASVSVVVTARIAATDEQSVSTVASHIGQRHGLVVKQQVWDGPWHPQKLELNRRLRKPLEVAS